MRQFLVLEMRHEEGMKPELAYANITCFGPEERLESSSIDIEPIRVLEAFDANFVRSLIRKRDIVTKSSRTLYKALALYLPDIHTNKSYCNKVIGITRAYTPKGSDRVCSFVDVLKRFQLNFKDVESFLKETQQSVKSQPIVDSVCFDLLVLQRDLNEKYALWQTTYSKSRK